MIPDDALVIASRGIVAGVLAVAAVAKFRDPAGTRAALAAAGLPGGLDRTLPTVEAFTAFGLIMETRTAWAAYVACALLVAFTLFVAVQLRRGMRTPCPCFGAVSTNDALGPRTVVRNLVLIALAVIATSAATSNRLATLLVAGAAALGVTVIQRR